MKPEIKSFADFIGTRKLNTNSSVMPQTSERIRMRGPMLKKARFIDNFDRFPSDLEIELILLDFVRHEQKICLKSRYTFVNYLINVTHFS